MIYYRKALINSFYATFKIYREGRNKLTQGQSSKKKKDEKDWAVKNGF